MKTKIYAAAVLGLGFMMFGNYAKAQIQDEQNVTITMDLEPVLQLNMNTPDEINFTFNTIPQYIAGEIHYGGTILTVSSTVNWALYAVGTSSNGTSWDNAVSYGISGAGNPNASTTLPLNLLELHQYGVNPNLTTYAVGCAVGKGQDYSAAFVPANTAPVMGQNNIYVGATAYTAPAATDKYIAGGNPTLAGSGVVGGSYLTQTLVSAGYYYVIDYRIVPGLPVVFPFAAVDDCSASTALVSPQFAQPGVYTMDVKYVLIEAQ